MPFRIKPTMKKNCPCVRYKNKLWMIYHGIINYKLPIIQLITEHQLCIYYERKYYINKNIHRRHHPYPPLFISWTSSIFSVTRNFLSGRYKQLIIIHLLNSIIYQQGLCSKPLWLRLTVKAGGSEHGCERHFLSHMEHLYEDLLCKI